MSRLFIRKTLGKNITFVHSKDELNALIDNYTPKTSLLLGDLSTFSNPMVQLLLKFVEENALVDCYSSQDIYNPILLSRFLEVSKTPLEVESAHSVDEFKDSPKDFASVYQHLSDFPASFKLLAYKSSSSIFNLLNALS